MDELTDPPPLAAVASLVGARILRGDPQRKVLRLAPLASAGADDLSFLSDSRYSSQARDTAAGAVLARAHDAQSIAQSSAVLAVDDPYRALAAIARDFARRQQPPRESGIHPTAIVCETARIGAGAWIGPQAVVEQDACIGARAWIGAGVVIGARAIIGEDSVLNARAVVYQRCRIGARALIHSGAVIGADGFGFAQSGDQWEKIPQLGAVVIGDDVEIGANTTIDRGTLDDTVIGDGCKLDNQIQIGHNVRLGEDTALAGCVGIAGSAVIGRRCRIGGGAGILGHLEICDDVTISSMSLVTRSLRRPGFYSGVFPLMDNASWERAAATLRRLPDLRSRLRALEQGQRRGDRADQGSTEAPDDGVPR